MNQSGANLQSIDQVITNFPQVTLSRKGMGAAAEAEVAVGGSTYTYHCPHCPISLPLMSPGLLSSLSPKISAEIALARKCPFRPLHSLAPRLRHPEVLSCLCHLPVGSRAPG